MYYIQPILKPVNNQDVITWRNKYFEDRDKYEKFTNEMKMLNITEDEIDKKWVYNFGKIPPAKPEYLYACNIINSDIKLSVIVKKIEDPSLNQRTFEVVKLNKLILDSYDYTRIMNTEMELKFDIFYKDLSLGNGLYENNTLYLEKDNNNYKTILAVSKNGEDLYFLKQRQEYIDENGDLIIKLSMENGGLLSKTNLTVDTDNNDGLTSSELLLGDKEITFNQTEESLLQNEHMILEYVELYDDDKINELYKLNYEDSEWFSLVSIQNMLSKLQIKVEPMIIEEGIKYPIPKAFLFNMNHIEIVDFDFNDQEFKNKLYDLVDKKFKELIIK